ncbi:MAG: ParB/RepB/Spo0J family partition protein, partial [Clostridia bacterium]|nr:ParB/RepB/Spo0J family partition protein [Clostridia bacterium]
MNSLNVRYIPTNLIVPNPFQARKNYDGESIIRLADSIKRYGIIQPVGVRRYTAGKFELVFGERRVRAAKLIDLQEIPCIIIENIGHRTSCELAFAENTLREPFDIGEKAGGVETLMRRFGAERNDVCRNLSIYRDEMDFLLEILRLSAPEREAICSSTLTCAHIKPILKIGNSHVRMHLINVIDQNCIPAAGCEKFIEEYLRSPKNSESVPKRVKPKATRHLVL